MRLPARMAVLLTVLAATLAPMAPATANAQNNETIVRIAISGDPLVNISRKVFANLMRGPRPAEFVVTSVRGRGIRLTERSSGGVVYAPGGDDYEQLAVARPRQTPVNSVWIAEAADERTSGRTGDPIRTGHYYLRLRGHDKYAGRLRAEDRSLRPKRVVLNPNRFEGQNLVHIEVID